MCENVSVTRNRGYHHGNLRAALIEAGLKLIEEKGVPALTLREIGTRLGVSRMAAYRHFASKADLLSAISEAGFSRFAGALEEARSKARGNSAARLLAMALAYVRFAAEHRAYYEVMFALPPESRPGSGSAERAFGVLEEATRQGQEAGEIREGNPVLLARLLWAVVHGISTLGLAADLSRRGKGTQFVKFCSKVLQTGLTART
jgi:AcrR family transcriptional regulator